MSDLWTTASADVEAEQYNRRLTEGRIAAASAFTFAAQANSESDLDNRLALVDDRVEKAAREVVGDLDLPGVYALKDALVEDIRTTVASTLPKTASCPTCGGGEGEDDMPSCGHPTEAWDQETGHCTYCHDTTASRTASKIDTLRAIVENKQHAKVDGVDVDMQTANAIVMVYDALKDESNKAKFETLPIGALADFAWKHVSSKGVPESRWLVSAMARNASEGQTCSVCGDKIAKDPSGEEPATWHHDNGEKHDHEAKPAGDSKEAAALCRGCGARPCVNWPHAESCEGNPDKVPSPCGACGGLGYMGGDQRDRECPECRGTGLLPAYQPDGQPWGFTSTRKQAGVYCNTHDVWVGDGNASTHEDCSKEQKATKASRTAKFLVVDAEGKTVETFESETDAENFIDDSSRESLTVKEAATGPNGEAKSVCEQCGQPTISYGGGLDRHVMMRLDDDHTAVPKEGSRRASLNEFGGEWAPWTDDRLGPAVEAAIADLSSQSTAAEVVARLSEAFASAGGYQDSIDREHAFTDASEATGIDYNDIYDAWMAHSNWGEHTASRKQAGAPSTVCPDCAGPVEPLIYRYDGIDILRATCDACGWTGHKQRKTEASMEDLVSEARLSLETMFKDPKESRKQAGFGEPGPGESSWAEWAQGDDGTGPFADRIGQTYEVDYQGTPGTLRVLNSHETAIELHGDSGLGYAAGSRFMLSTDEATDMLGMPRTASRKPFSRQAGEVPEQFKKKDEAPTEETSPEEQTAEKFKVVDAQGNTVSDGFDTEEEAQAFIDQMGQDDSDHGKDVEEEEEPTEEKKPPFEGRRRRANQFSDDNPFADSDFGDKPKRSKPEDNVFERNPTPEEQAGYLPMTTRPRQRPVTQGFE